MPVRDVRKNYQLFVDGRGYAGQTKEFTPPSPSLVTEDFRGGGMDGSVPIDMGIEPLETTFSLTAFDRDVLSLWGLAPGNEIPFVCRGALESFDGTSKGEVHTMRGIVTKVDPGTFNNSEPTLQITAKLSYYRLTVNGQDTIEIDVPNMIRKINGVDRLAQQRRNIGR